ncbi:MAG: hypothetical protein R2860_04645 [Desulfobacterales bacterium]
MRIVCRPRLKLKRRSGAQESLLADLTDEKLKYKTLKKLNYLILKLNTMRSGAVKFEIPQRYEAQVVGCLSDDNASGDRKK